MFKARRNVRKTIFLLTLILVMAITAFSAISVMPVTVKAATALTYTVKSGDSLWLISSRNGLSISQLKQYNGLTTDIIYPGQFLRLAPSVKYYVKAGDTLWLIAKNNNTTIDAIKTFNMFSTDIINVNQLLYIPQSVPGTTTGSTTGTTTGTTGTASTPVPTSTTGTTVTRPAPVTSWPSITYIVKAGDYVSVVAARFGVPQSDILKYNYMTINDWLNEGEKIAINGYAPRNWAVVPGEDSSPARVGKLVDWFLDGQYALRRNDVFLITDYKTGVQFKVKMMGGVNHSDVEPLTAADTAIMKNLFPTWTWDPRPVVIFFNGMNIAASISGMPHSYDTIADNNVSGHFDLYLFNSTGHSSTTSQTYIAQHQANVLTAAGR